MSGLVWVQTVLHRFSADDTRFKKIKVSAGYFFMLLSADFLSKSTFTKSYFRNTIRVLNSLDPNCLHRYSANNTCRQRVI